MIHMTEVIQHKNLLKLSNVENPVTKKQLKNRLTFKNPHVEPENIDFNHHSGKYTVHLTNDGIVEVCVTCGETQPMNDEAMSLYYPSMIDEIDTYKWDNNRCETRHKPFEVDL
jgi:hypothetical protein